MKTAKFLLFPIIILFLFACTSRDKKVTKQSETETIEATAYVPLDKGFSEYISGYTSGIIPANSPIEIRFTSDFASGADKEKLAGLFTFEPAIKGKTEWLDNMTLVFRPARMLEPGKTYNGSLNLYKISAVKERLNVFPFRIQTLKKDFQVTFMNLECSSTEGNTYDLNGVIVASDFIEPKEVESYLDAKLNRKSVKIGWDHTPSDNTHKFTIAKVERTENQQELTLKWDGSGSGVKQKGSTTIIIPAQNDFSVQDVLLNKGENQRIDIIFSDPIDAKQEMEGLIWLNTKTEITLQINSNIISVSPATNLNGTVVLNIEATLKNIRGMNLSSSWDRSLDFTSIKPGIMLSGNGVILPVSGNLIFPFKAANLKAVDLKIIKIFENNLPYFLQENDLNSSSYLKRFGRPVYSGRVDLANSTSINANKWNLYTVDLSDYIDVEPGVLYKVQLGMRNSYSLYPCSESSETGKYEEMLHRAEEQQQEYWEDPENYYEDFESSVFYRYGYDWEERDNPCKDAYYDPGKSISRNILASNLGLIAKKGEDNILHVMVNDISTAVPVNEVTVEVYDLQMQLINSGKTNRDGSVTIFCARKTFPDYCKKR